MILYPAIDLKEGACVRLYKGAMESATIYNHNPAAQAKIFAEEGFEWIHIVDLNGAIDGKPVNENAVKEIVAATDLKLQLGGGIRNLNHIETWLNAGIDRVILGSIAVKDPQFVKDCVQKFPQKIVLGLDILDEFVAVQGWVEKSNLTATELLQNFEGVEFAGIIVTDISRDGTGRGVNTEICENLKQHTNAPLIASGGVGSLRDIEAVKTAKLSGMIIGKALYEKKIDSAVALNLAKAA